MQNQLISKGPIQAACHARQRQRAGCTFEQPQTTAMLGNCNTTVQPGMFVQITCSWMSAAQVKHYCHSSADRVFNGMTLAKSQHELALTAHRSADLTDNSLAGGNHQLPATMP